MSLTTYPELKIAIADWMERGDLAARAGDFVALAESRLNRLLRSPALEREATVTVAQGERTAAAPPDLREPLRLWLDGDGEASVLPYRDAGDLPRDHIRPRVGEGLLQQHDE